MYSYTRTGKIPQAHTLNILYQNVLAASIKYYESNSNALQFVNSQFNTRILKSKPNKYLKKLIQVKFVVRFQPIRPMKKSKGRLWGAMFWSAEATHLRASPKQQALLDVLLQLIKTWPLTIGPWKNLQLRYSAEKLFYLNRFIFVKDNYRIWKISPQNVDGQFLQY